MTHDLFHATASSTLALLRRAMMFHHATTTPVGASAQAPRADRDASQSLTERHLQVLGVGQPPDRAEMGIPGFRW